MYFYSVVEKRKSPTRPCRMPRLRGGGGAGGEESGSQENGNNANIIKNDRKNERLLAVSGSPHE